MKNIRQLLNKQQQQQTELKKLLKLEGKRLDRTRKKQTALLQQASEDVKKRLSERQQDAALERAKDIVLGKNKLYALTDLDNYCNRLIAESAELVGSDSISKFPRELQEAVAGLVYAASRVDTASREKDLTDLTVMFANMFGTEFVNAASNNSSGGKVNPKLSSMLSTKQPSPESLKKALKKIADENGITLAPFVKARHDEEASTSRGMPPVDGMAVEVEPDLALAAAKAMAATALRASTELSRGKRAAHLFGSASEGLGFYHVDVEASEERSKHLPNCWVLTIVKGDIDEAGIRKSLVEMYEKRRSWPSWAVRRLDKPRFDGSPRYLIRAPPPGPTKEFSADRFGPLIARKASVGLRNLNGGHVDAVLSDWDGDCEQRQLQDTWVQIKGVPPKWVDGWTINCIASSLGRLVDVDSLALSFRMIRVKIKCRDPSKIPPQIEHEMDNQLYSLSLIVEDREHGNAKTGK